MHAVPDFGATDFKFVDAVEYSPSYANSTYRTVGIYQGVRAGSRQWKVFRNSSNIAETQQVLAEGTTNFVAGQYYTILHTGFANAAIDEIWKGWLVPRMFADTASGRLSPEAALDLYAAQAAAIHAKWRERGKV